MRMALGSALGDDDSTAGSCTVDSSGILSCPITIMPCLSGAGPLAPGQAYCNTDSNGVVSPGDTTSPKSIFDYLAQITAGIVPVIAGGQPAVMTNVNGVQTPAAASTLTSNELLIGGGIGILVLMMMMKK